MTDDRGETGEPPGPSTEPSPPEPLPPPELPPPPEPLEVPPPGPEPDEAPRPDEIPFRDPEPTEVPAPQPDVVPPAHDPPGGPVARASGLSGPPATHAPASNVATTVAGASAPSVLEVRGLTKRYGAVHALSGLDLTVRAGEVYGFLGRNGAGKSTTIRILMGITERTSGTVSLFGEPAQKRDTVRARQRIGYVAQEQTFYGWMTLLRLASFVSAFFPTWDQAELLRLARKLDVPLDRKIGTFSGGMRVKVALAVALAHRPPLLLLDEPTAGLDPVARREFLEIVRDESRASGRTTFFSSHLVDEVELVAHRVGIVDGGRTRYEGRIDDLAARVRLVTRPVDTASPPSTTTSELATLGFGLLFHETLDGLERFYVEAPEPGRFDRLAAGPGLALRVSKLPLEEIFVAMVRRRPSA